MPTRRSRYLRILSTALVTAGLVILADAGVTLAWGEPLSAARAWLAQNEAADELEELEERFAGPNRSSLAPGRIAGFADRLARTARTGQGIGRMEIEAIDLDVVFVEGTDTASLRKGPGHYPRTALPGERGTVGIAGHRTTYGAPFRDIDELESGDEIVIEMPYGRFTYQVEKQRIVDPTRVGVVRDVDHDRLVMTACHPLYSTAERIVVFSRLIEVEPGLSGRYGPPVSARQLERLRGSRR